MEKSESGCSNETSSEKVQQALVDGCRAAACQHHDHSPLVYEPAANPYIRLKDCSLKSSLEVPLLILQI